MSLRAVLVAVGLACVGPLAAAGPAAGRDGAPAAALALERGDRIAVIGSVLAERMQHHGALETRLQQQRPELELRVRHLGFSGDELTVAQRTAGFGSRDDWLARCRASVVLACFGTVESFRGPAHLPRFREDLSAFVAHVRGTAYDGVRPPRLVLVSPIAVEDLGDPRRPDADAANARLLPYVVAMRDVARAHDVPFVDLFAPTRARFAQPDALTTDGTLLDARGEEEVARLLAAALLGSGAPIDASGEPGASDVSDSPDSPATGPLRAAVLAKDRAWFDRYRATDGYNVYGGRSTLAYVGGQTNADVLGREMEILEAITAQLDRRIHALARGDVAAADAIDVTPGTGPIPAPVPVTTNRPGPNPDASHAFLAAEEAIARMTPAPGLVVELVASEATSPLVVNPVQMAFDPAGRLWVAVWPSYPHGRPGTPYADALLVLEDDDGDGRTDRVVPFADDLHNPTGFEFWGGGVLVANAPDLLFLRDTDGDGRADVRERVLHGLSSADTHHTANSFVLGPDGALYFQEGIFHQSQIETAWGPVRNRDACVWRFEPRSGRVERYAAYDFLNPHGHVFDRWGQDFVTDGTGNESYYALPFSGHVEQPRKHGAYFPFFAPRSRPAAATEILSSAHVPPAYRDSFVVANVIGFQGLFQHALEDDGSGFAARELMPLVQSDDPNFRPVDVEVGPDGAVYLLDWHNPLIGHMQHHLRDPSRDRSHGRVYRLRAPDRPFSRSPAIAGRPLAELLAALEHPEDRVRYRARLELSGRASDEVVAAARTWAAALDPGDPGFEHHRLEALWTLTQHGALDEPLLDGVLASPEPRARAAAARVLRVMRERLGADGVLARLATLVEDPFARVRLEAVVAASFVEDARAAEIALRALAHARDRFLDYALAETIATLAPWWRAALVAGEDFAGGDAAALAYVLATLDTAELLRVPPSAPVLAERLARHGQDVEVYLDAARGLALARGTTPLDELLDAIERADASGHDGGHADHLLSGLFDAVARIPRAMQAARAGRLRALATSGRRDATRRLASVAGMRADGSIDAAWTQAERDPAALADLLDAALLLDDPELCAALFPRVLARLDAPASDAHTHDARDTRDAYDPLASAETRARRAALRCLPTLGVREDEALARLVAALDDPALRATAIETLPGVPFERWPAALRATLAGALRATFATEVSAAGADRRLLALADALVPHVPADVARPLALARARLGPQVVVIRPVRDALLYDVAEFTVVAGRPVEIVFENVDIMPHNLVVTAPGALASVGLAAEAMAREPDAWARAFVPDRPDVLAATGLLQPGAAQTLAFDAPAVPGDHPYVCTFPGHWVRMNGIMHVVTQERADALAGGALAAGSSPAREPADGAPSRAFVTTWTPADFGAGDLVAVDRASPARGRAILEAASCLLCHPIDAQGGPTGPDLREVVARHDRASLLAQILDPSATILEGYDAELLVTADERVLSGRVVHEDDAVLHVRDNPYADALTIVARDELTERRPSTVSTMPEGLLSTFERQEILDLLAYLESLRQ